MAKKREFNNYIIEGDAAKIEIIRNDGQIIYALVDAEDIELIKLKAGSVYSAWHPDIQNYYIVTTDYLGIIDEKQKYKTVLLHHIIKPVERGYNVDHINHNTIDNRKSNLRVIEAHKNASNRKGANKNSSTGVRNVNYSESGNCYLVQFMKKGERFCWYFSKDKFEEACKFAEDKRKELFGRYGGKDTLVENNPID